MKPILNTSYNPCHAYLRARPVKVLRFGWTLTLIPEGGEEAWQKTIQVGIILLKYVFLPRTSK